MKRILGISYIVMLGLAASGCEKKPAAAPTGAGMQAMPVQTALVTLAPVPLSSEYVATIKSRRSATLLPQVSGLVTRILVRSGDHVTAGQLLMEIDPRYADVIVRRYQEYTGKQAVLGDGNYNGATFEHVKDGRIREWEDQIGNEAFKAEKPAAAEAERAEGEGR